MTARGVLVFLVLAFLSPAALADGGSLSGNIRIESQVLGYALQYRVYRPEGVDAGTALPTLYVTDGQWYLKGGDFGARLDRLTRAQAIRPVMAVFVDARNPDKLDENRRNDQYMCNPAYARFFKGELVPAVETGFAAASRREARLVMGVSFGGLNAGCFALMAPDVFGNAAMQSPASADHVKLLAGLFRKNPVQPVRLYLSVGTKRDNTGAIRRFRHVLERKGYDLTYREVPFGHEWANWAPLIDDVLVTFYGMPETR